VSVDGRGNAGRLSGVCFRRDSRGSRDRISQVRGWYGEEGTSSLVRPWDMQKSGADFALAADQF
jgi:hypothetical protein